jgi:Spy/CpxP family protein refolding chaperone
MKNEPRQIIMKANKTMLIAALAAGSLLVWSPALRAGDSTNTPSSTPPAGAPPAGPRGPGMRGQSNIDQLAKQLELTETQKPKFQAIMDARRQKMRDLQQEPGFKDLSPQDRAAKMKAIHDEADAQIKALLTPEQYAKWEKMPMSSMRGRPPGSRPGGENAKDTNAPAAPLQK